MRTGPRLEPLGADVLVDDVLAVGAAHDAGARHRDALLLARRSSASTVTNWPARRPAVSPVDGEMHRDRLVAVGEAGAAVS